MDLQLQEILNKKTNRPSYSPAQSQQPPRGPPVQRPPQFLPPTQFRNQNPQIEKKPQQNQFINFPKPARVNYQGGPPTNQAYNQNIPKPNQYQQNNDQGYQRPSPNRFNQNQQNVNQFQQPKFPQSNRQYSPNQYKKNPQFQQQSQFSQVRGRGRGKPFQNQAPYQNQRKQPNQYDSQSQQRPAQRGRGNFNQNMSQQQLVLNAFKQYAQQQFHQAQRGRGRGRGRGARGGRSPTRMNNQHQRPYDSEMDSRQNKQRLQKFQPKPTTTARQFPKPVQKKPQSSFIAKSNESMSIAEQQSQKQDSQQGSYDDQSGSYSDEYSNEGSVQQKEGSHQQQQYSDEGENASQENGQQVQEESQILPSKIVSMKSLDMDVSTGAINEMCSKQQFNERLQTFESNNKELQHSKLKLDTSRSFSIFEINKRTLKPDYSLALKRFKRSSDRAEGKDQVDTKDMRRSVKALAKVINHINKQIIDADNMRQKDLAFPTPPNQKRFQFIHVYDFLWDRMRQMIKDIMRLSQKQKLTRQTITICEQIARFFILSINQGRKEYTSRLTFSERMNIQSILKVFSNLMEFYRQSRMNLKGLIQGLSDSEKQNITIQKIQSMMESKNIYISPYEPELSAYSLLFSDDRTQQFYQILTIGFEDQQTQSENPLINSEQMQKALKVHRILNQKNIQQYFNKIQQPQTDYIFSCIMLKHLQRMRKNVSQVLFKTHLYERDGKKQNIMKNSLLAETLRKTLRFHQSQKQQFQEFLESLGVQIHGKILTWRQSGFNQPLYFSPEYIFQNDKLNRNDWTDSQCKKHIKDPTKLSREQLIKSSWKKSNYHHEIIKFYLGTDIQISKRQVKRVPVPKQISRVPKQISKQIPSQEHKQMSKQQAAINLSALNEMRKGLQKKQKRGRFLQKLQNQILQLYRHTDQAKIMNRKKSLAIIDQWMMYYHDKMLRISLNLIQNQSRKKNLITNILREIKTFSGIKKQFAESYNRQAYQFEPSNVKNIIPQRNEKGLMSGLLSKAHFKAKKTTFDSFEEYLSLASHKLEKSQLNFFILTTCGSSSHSDKILFDLMLYFVYQRKIDPIYKLRQIKQVIKAINSKQKTVPVIRVHFQDQNIYLNLKVAKINDVKSKRKAIVENSHIIQHLFGCNSLFIVRQNSKYHTSQMVLQTFEEFVSNKSRIYQANQEEEQKYKIQTLKRIDLPILLVNILKKSLNPDEIKMLAYSSDGTPKFAYLQNISEISIIQGSTQPIKLPFMLKDKIQKQLIHTQKYSKTMSQIIRYMNRFVHQKTKIYLSSQLRQARLCLKPLSQLLKQIRINASYIQQKLQPDQKYGNIRRQFIFSYYQQYFNLCLNQLISEISFLYKNSLLLKKWVIHILLSQNIVNSKDLYKNDSTQNNESNLTRISLTQQQNLINHTLESQAEYNVVSQTFKEYQFLKRILEQLKMRFVGENIEPIQTRNLIFEDEDINIFGLPTTVAKDKPSRQQIQLTLYHTHFINTIEKYLNMFDSGKGDNKFEKIWQYFQTQGLKFRIFNCNRDINNDDRYQRAYKNTIQQKYNYQIQGESSQFYSYLFDYLIQGCKNINVIVPDDFRFRINPQQFERKSMRNLSTVIACLNTKKRDTFQNLKYSRNKDLLKGLLNENQNNNKNHSTAINVDQQNYGQDSQNVIIIQDDLSQNYGDDNNKYVGVNDNKKDKSFKRQIGYQFHTIYPSNQQGSDYVYSRVQRLNELRKIVKT